MRRFATGLLGVLVVFSGWAVTAGASSGPSCGAEAVRIAFQHSQVWRQAGSPKVVCGSTPATGRAEVAGYYDLTANAIYLRGGLVGYNRLVAHELGHAWLFHRHDPARVKKYARIRGFGTDTDVVYSQMVLNDYAETFALTLGEWAEIDTPAPYGFKTPVGLPTDAQVARLRHEGVLP